MAWVIKLSCKVKDVSYRNTRSCENNFPWLQRSLKKINIGHYYYYFIFFTNETVMRHMTSPDWLTDDPAIASFHW